MTKRTPKGVVAELAWKDLIHEWILSLCIVLALAAIVTPLLIVLGLKEGFITHLRADLIQDPVYREIRPAQTVDLPEDWFETMRARPDVAFVTPGILRGASIVRAMTGDDAVSLDLLPTGPGDPLILENAGIVPGAGEVVLSAPAAEDLKRKVGDTLEMRVSRTYGGRLQQRDVTLRIVAVLAERADLLPRLYAPLQLVVDVESYKEGLAVPGRDWEGGDATPVLAYDGVMMVADRPFEPILRRRLTTGTGFATAATIEPGAMRARLGVAPQDSARILDLRVFSTAVTRSSLRMAGNRARGRFQALLPYVDPFAARLSAVDAAPDAEGHPAVILGYSQSEKAAARAGMAAPPWGAPDEEADFDALARILLPAGHPLTGAQMVTAQFDLPGGTVAIPLAVSGTAPGAEPVVPVELLAMLRGGGEREMRHDAASGSLRLSRLGYRGFRLYARAIEDVPALSADLKAQGFEVIARTQDIIRLQNLDRSLTSLFLLIAAVGAVGGVAALLANLYAAVERKRAEIGMMRLLGLAPGSVFSFPVYQGLTLVAATAGLALLVFAAIAGVLNGVFAAELNGDAAVHLPARHIVIIAVAAGVAAIASALAAALRAVRIEPAEAIRAE